MRILVVDDEKIVVEHLKNSLAKKGDVVHVALSGEEAIKIVTTAVYDIVLVDYHLPGKSGLDVFKTVKEVTPKTKVLLLTGYPLMKEAIAKFAGVDEYLEKPLDVEEIQAAIEKYRPEFT